MKFLEVAEVFEKIESKSGRIEMAELLAKLFKKMNADEAERVAYIIQGELLPPYMGVDIGIGEKFVLQAIANASGFSRKEVEGEYAKLGDLGKTAEKLIGQKKQRSLHSEDLTIVYVYSVLMKIAQMSGTGSQEGKIKRLVELLNNAKPVEAKYIVRFVMNQLRLGVRVSTLLDALSMSAKGDKSLKPDLERAFNLCSDIGYVAKEFKKSPKKIKKFKIEIFKPVMPALAERLPNSAEILKKIGECAAEQKYDGFRMSIHKKEKRVEIYSRRLEKITHSYPDIVHAAEKVKAKNIIFEGEALAYNEKEKKFYSFQETMHRRRKYGIKEAKEKYPLRLFVFDIQYLNGKDYTTKPYAERRKEIEKMFSKKGMLVPSGMRIVKEAKELDRLFHEAVKEGLEGVIAKDLKAPYTAGARKFAWIKLKKSYGKEVDTVDAVIMGYFRGSGARSKFGFGGLLTAVYNEKTGRFETIAKVGSGFTEEEMKSFRKELEKLETKEPPKDLDYELKPHYWVKPKIVVEIAFDNITKSPTHTCGKEKGKGYALRFPRFMRIRDDKSPKQSTTTKEIVEMYRMQ